MLLSNAVVSRWFPVNARNFFLYTISRYEKSVRFGINKLECCPRCESSLILCCAACKYQHEIKDLHSTSNYDKQVCVATKWCLYIQCLPVQVIVNYADNNWVLHEYVCTLFLKIKLQCSLVCIYSMLYKAYCIFFLFFTLIVSTLVISL